MPFRAELEDLYHKHTLGIASITTGVTKAARTETLRIVTLIFMTADGTFPER